MPNKDYRIYSSINPVAHSGDTVSIDVSQPLAPKGGGAPILHASGPIVEVQIQGPQVQLTEADIVGVYPAAGSTDSPDNYLPHIALTRRTLPWERVGPVADPKSTTPWLALLVLTDVDMRLNTPFVIAQTGLATQVVEKAVLANPTPAPPPPEVRLASAAIKPSVATTANLVDQAVIKGNIPQPTVPHFTQGSLTPKSVLVSSLQPAGQDPDTYKQLIKIPGMTAGTTISTLAIPAPTLKMLLPANPADLALLCNVKDVIDGPGDGTFTSIVISRRLPDAGDGSPNTPVALHTAVLVSLEQRTDIWTRFDKNEFINVVVLHSWTFTPSKGGDFREVCKLIGTYPNGGVLRFGNLPQVVKTPVVSPLTPGLAAALDSDGYLIQPLDHAEQGQVVWRGPLRPFPPPARNAGVAVRSAPEEWTNQPATVKLDYSHATAFELGKLLAIADEGIREDLRDIHKHFNIPNKYYVAVSQLPEALQRPYWGIDLGESLDTAQQQLDKSLASPWANSSQGAQQSLVTVAATLGQGDFTGVASIAQANGWVASVTTELNLAATEAPSGVSQVSQIDISATVVDSALSANLELQFPELINGTP